MKSLLTSIQTHDITKAVPLLEGLPTRHVIADKGYDRNKVLQAIHEQGGDAVTPPRATAKFNTLTASDSTSNATKPSVCSRGSSNADALPPVTTKPPETSLHSCT